MNGMVDKLDWTMVHVAILAVDVAVLLVLVRAVIGLRGMLESCDDLRHMMAAWLRRYGEPAPNTVTEAERRAWRTGGGE